MKISNITMIILTAFVSIVILIFQNIALFFVTIYLWLLIIKENKKNKLNKRVYDIIKNNKEYIDISG